MLVDQAAESIGELLNELLQAGIFAFGAAAVILVAEVLRVRWGERA